MTEFLNIVFFWINLLFGLFDQMWTVFFYDGIGGVLMTVDAFVCLLGAVMTLVVWPLIPLDILPLRASQQRLAIAIVGIAMFAVFLGHWSGRYATIRIAELIFHATATWSLITGAWLRAGVVHVIRQREARRLLLK